MTDADLDYIENELRATTSAGSKVKPWPPTSGHWGNAITRLETLRSPPPPPPPPPPPTTSALAWDATKAAVLSDSAAQVAKLFTYAGQFAYFYPEVGHAVRTSATPSYTITSAGHKGKLDPVLTIPDGTQPGISYDHHLVVQDQVTGRMHDFEMYETTSPDAARYYDAATGRITGWTDGTSMPLDAIQEPQGGSSNAAALALAAGAVSVAEIEAGTINHALVFSCSAVGSGTPVYPANTTSGESTPGNIVLGQWLRLALSATLGPNPTKLDQLIFAALKRFGMFLRDQGQVAPGGDVTIHALDEGGGGRSFPTYRTAGVALNSKGVAQLTAAIPWHQLEFLAPPPHLDMARSAGKVAA